MKSAIFIVSVALCMSSCISRKYCDRKFPDTTFNSTNKSIEIITKYRDTTIYINIKGDTSGWQWFQIWLGRVLIFFSIIYFGFKILRLTG